jgi:hypothetical protein
MFEDTKGLISEAVNRRRSDNTMAKRKGTKGQTIHRKLKIQKHRNNYKCTCMLTEVFENQCQWELIWPFVMKVGMSHLQYH